MIGLLVKKFEFSSIGGVRIIKPKAFRIKLIFATVEILSYVLIGVVLMMGFRGKQYARPVLTAGLCSN